MLKRHEVEILLKACRNCLLEWALSTYRCCSLTESRILERLYKGACRRGKNGADAAER